MLRYFIVWILRPLATGPGQLIRVGELWVKLFATKIKALRGLSRIRAYLTGSYSKVLLLSLA